MPFISRSAGVRTWTLSAALALSTVLSPIPASAQGPPAATPAPAPDSEEQDLLARANAAAAAGDLEQADLAYHLLLTSYPKSPLRDQVYFGLAQIDQQQQNYADAASLYQNLLNEFPDSPLSGPARHQLAEAYISLGQYDSAVSALELERNLTRDPASRDDLTNRIVDVYVLKKDRVQAVIELQKQAGGREEENRAIEGRIQQLLDQSSKGDLEELVRRFPKGFPGDAALLRLADLHESAQEYFEADRELRRFLSIYPKHRAVPAVRSKILSIRQVEMGHRYLIGALLPMSGRLKPFGQQVLNGIRLAMDSGTGNAPEKSVGLVVKDTEGDAAALQSGLEELLREYRVIAIIGPLLSRQVVAAAPRSESYRVPLLTPSASEPWSKSWKFVLRNSITSRQQAREIADYAVNTLNEKRFCILFSNDAYGGEMMRAFTEEVGKFGGEIIARASYDPDATDFGPQIKYLKDADLAKYGVLGPPPEQKGELREYKPGFDGIFIPGDYNEVGLIAPQLAFYNIQGVTMLGTNGWDSPDLFRIGGKYVDGGIFVDGFYPASSDPAVRSFVDRYRNRFNEEPSLLAAQAYDTASLILKSIQQGASSGETIRDFVSRVQNFPGATGPINFTPEGDLAKRLYVIQAKDGKFIQIK
jgi:ABC-type branched-subunit amino acid transport system substrate-binding protein/predicted negative regulator of RcsB-dependent stress response